MNQSSKITAVCLNPDCPTPSKRCLTLNTAAQHPFVCLSHIQAASTIMNTNWKSIEAYPKDKLGSSVKQKVVSKGTWLTNQIAEIKRAFNESLDYFTTQIMDLYPQTLLQVAYERVYSLDVLSECLAKKSDESVLTKIINASINSYAYLNLGNANEQQNSLLDDLRLFSKEIHSFSDTILHKHKKPQLLSTEGNKYICGMSRSKFRNSSAIQLRGNLIVFPKINSKLESMLPWVYSDNRFHSGTHALKLTSLCQPLCDNAGVTILNEQNTDVYPYQCYRSLFNQASTGFTDISQLRGVARQSSITVTIYLDCTPPKATIACRQVVLSQCVLIKDSYRIGIYGSGWKISLEELY